MNRSMYEYRSPAGLGQALGIMLIVMCLLLLLSLGLDFMEINLLQRIMAGDDYTLDEIATNDTRNQQFAIFVLIYNIALAIVFLKWIYRTAANAHVYSPANMTYSAGWSVGWFFIPILNLFRPYQAMKETWQVSSAGPGDDPSFNVKVPSIVSLWWTLWILSLFSSQISFRLIVAADTPQSLIAADYASIVDSMLHLGLTLVALKMVKDLSKIQADRGDTVYGKAAGKACPECGEVIQASATSCPMCGARINTIETDSFLKDESNPFAM